MLDAAPSILGCDLRLAENRTGGGCLAEQHPVELPAGSTSMLTKRKAARRMVAAQLRERDAGTLDHQRSRSGRQGDPPERVRKRSQGETRSLTRNRTQPDGLKKLRSRGGEWIGRTGQGSPQPKLQGLANWRRLVAHRSKGKVVPLHDFSRRGASFAREVHQRHRERMRLPKTTADNQSASLLKSLGAHILYPMQSR